MQWTSVQGISITVFLILKIVRCSIDTCDGDRESCSKEIDMATGENWKNAASIYDFHAKDIDGKDLTLDKYKGEVVIIVNVACQCGFTQKSYTQLQALYEKYQTDGLRIACFPSNEFGGQEPLPEPEIKKYVEETFHVTFDMYSKINVNGDGAHPLFKYLKSKQHGTLGDWIKWNFSKFLIDRQGQPISRYSPMQAPNDFEDDIVKALGVQKKP